MKMHHGSLKPPKATGRLTPGRSLVLLLCLTTAARAESNDEGVRFFETHIRPLLVERCYECHSAESKKLRGKLRLDSAEGWTRGGESGASIVPGKPDESLLIKAVRHTDKELQMPPKERLADRQIKLLEEWVKRGAPLPKEFAKEGTVVSPQLERGRKHWAFQPIADPALPRVTDESWSATEVDRFILSSLEQAGLKPARAAGKRTLIRRATFDLTGLPPTPEEVRAFLADDSPQAFAKVVDRLLASPRYGERWGRHWLDVARYADSNGLDENIAHGNAWRYRDYVIDAFNSDKPFDRFVMEQVAGDVLGEGTEGRSDGRTKGAGSAKPQAAYAGLIATGFLSLGPKVLAEVDETKMEMDIVDEQVDTVGRAFLGLTIGCARCHDHKFDPITAADYYALAGIFKSTRSMEHFKKIARWWENPTPTAEDEAAQKKHEESLAALRGKIDAANQDANKALLAKLGPDAKLPEKPEPQYDDAAKANLAKLREELSKAQKNPPSLSTAMGVTEGKPVNLAIHVRGSHLRLGEVVPRRFPLALTEGKPRLIDGAGSGRLELAQWLVSKENPLTARVIVNRVWRSHFGRGLVRSMDNFGLLGEAPTHPQLLDWLARRFMDDRWSIKKLHRRIMLSRTYQMSGESDERAAAIDPGNRLYSHYSPRRLEAEAVRDAWLFVSDRLDLTMGGPAITHVKNREFLFDHTSKDQTTYDSTRRSVYLPVIRNHLYDLFELFDFPESATPLGDRATTTIAPQALLALNSPIVWEAAGKLAERAVQAESHEKARVAWLHETLFSRPPSEKELNDALAFLARAQRGGTEKDDAGRVKTAWRMYCQVLLISNEFLYVK